MTAQFNPGDPSDSDDVREHLRRTISKDVQTSETIEEYDAETGRLAKRTVRSEFDRSKITEDKTTKSTSTAARRRRLTQQLAAGWQNLVPTQLQVSVFEATDKVAPELQDFAGDYILSIVSRSPHAVRWEYRFPELKQLSRLSLTAQPSDGRLAVTAAFEGNIRGPHWIGLAEALMERSFTLHRNRNVPPSALADADWPLSIYVTPLQTSRSQQRPFYISPEPTAWERAAMTSFSSSSSSAVWPTPEETPPCEEEELDGECVCSEESGQCDCEECPCEEEEGTSCCQEENGGSGALLTSAEPIKYSNGQIILHAVDLSSSGFGASWQHRRTYDNRLSVNADVGQGYNWLVLNWPYLVEQGNGDITIVRSTDRSLWFDKVGSDYVGRFGAKSTFTHDPGNHLFILTLPNGQRLEFHDFSQDDFPGGMFARQIAPGGEVTEVTAYADNGHIGEIERSGMVGGNSLTEAFVYDYDNDDRLTSVRLRRRLGSGDWENVRQALYEYYDGEEDHGSLGDLKRVRVQVPEDNDWADSAVSYYRYYTTGDLEHGFIHGLKYVVQPATYDRMVADSVDPLTVSDVLLSQYADKHFQYDDEQRVILERVEGGSRTFTFLYINNPADPGPNVWSTHTIETRPDGSQMIVYTNSIGQPLIRELFKDGVGSWTNAYHYDGEYRRLWHANPSAVVGYDDSHSDLAIQLRPSDGLIEETEYYATTGGGAAAGYLAARKLRHGSTGTPVPQLALQYATHTAGSATVHPVSKQTTYRNEGGGDPIETTFTRTFHSGTTQTAEKITTLPVVPTSQNGTDVTATRREFHDSFGRLTWSMDERGFINHRVYNLATAAITQIIQDVDTSVVSGAPSGWTTPSGGGLNLVTDFEHDAQGRLLQKLGPAHPIDLNATPTIVRRAIWNVYDDVDHVTYSASGYFIPATSTSVLINPVWIIKRQANGKLLEEIQAIAPSTSGTLASIIATAGGGPVAFPQSSYVRWTTYQYSDCCKLASQRRYFNIPASGEGDKENNFDQTGYGYDSMNRRNHTTSPGGTVNFQTFDPRGLLLNQYAGLDDDGIVIDIVLLSENEYDGGSDGGDGNLTKRTQHVDDRTTRVTQYLYDWRNRQTATDGELNFYVQQFYDNLDRVVKTERRDGSDSGQLLSRNETLYDNRGRVYRTIRHGVDPSTGSVTGQQTHDQFYDGTGNLLRQEPAGSMEYQEFEYDSLSRRISESDPLEHSRLFAYDAASNMVSLTDPEEEVWTRGYDPLGRLVRSTNPLDQSTTYGYSDSGEQTTVTNALSETTTTTFDAAGRRVSVSDPLGKITSYTFDANGNETSVTDPNNLTTTSEYDYLDRLVKVTDPLSHSVQYTYNLAGELIVETDAKDQETTHAYDALGRRVATTDRLNQTTTFAWNALGLQESLTDAENQTTSYVYDEYQRLYQTIWPDHVSPSSPGDPDYGITQTEYDSLNRVLRTTDQLGDTITHTYDDAGRLLSRNYRTAANSPSGTIADSDTFTYDAASRLLTAVSGRYSNTVTLAYDAAGRQTSNLLTISGQTYTSTTQYDAAGRVFKLVYPDGSEVTQTYTARGQLATLAVDSTTIDTRTYDDGGRMTSSSYNNGVGETRSYNDDNTLASISYSGAAIGDLSYGWDANKNKTSESIGGVMSGYGFSAGYDAEDRLTSWDRADTNLDQSWDLSPVGDWNSITENASVQSRTHGPVHEILTAASQSVQHDPKGNMTLIPPVLRPGSDPLKLKWDFDNKLRAADTDDSGTDDVFYRWDALGRRVGRDDGTNDVVYFQDGQQTLADYPAGTAAGSPTYTYVYASYIDEVVMRSGGSGLRYYHRNQQYSITALTNHNGTIVERYAYTAYGQVTVTNASGAVRTASTNNNRFTYTGREWDAGLSLYHYRARMYDPVTGRFMGRDAIGYQGSKWNLFEQARSNPSTFIDPLGQDALRPQLDLRDNQGCCKITDLKLICRTMPAVYHFPASTHCYLAMLDENGRSIEVLSGQQGAGGRLGLSDTGWDQDYFRGRSQATQHEHPVISHTRDLCELYDCLYDQAGLIHERDEYSQWTNNSNTFLSEIMIRCSMSARFPRSAVASHDLSRRCQTNCLAGIGKNIITATEEERLNCVAICSELATPSVPYLAPDPYAGAPESFQGNR